MRYSRMGKSGLNVSQLCIGMMSYGSTDWQKWVLGYDKAEHFVRRALDGGINFFDSADFYSLGQSEEMLGKAIRKLTSRSSVAITTKVGLPMSMNVNDRGLSRKHILESIDRSLQKLQTEYVDVYFLHEPDLATPIEETIDTMAGLVRAGKVLYVGISNLPPWLAAKAVYYAKHEHRLPIACMQLHYNLCYREEERDNLPICEAESVGVMAYSPLARGFLAGNRVPEKSGVMSGPEALRASSDLKAQALFGSAADEAVLVELIKLAKMRGVPTARLAMAWVLANPLITSVICGVLDDTHLDEALQAAELELTAAERAQLEACYVAQAPRGTGPTVLRD